MADAKCKFDCFVDGEHFETSDLQRLIAFMKDHESCGDATPGPEQSGGSQ